MKTAQARTKVVLGPELAGALMTTDEFDAVDEYDENYHYELIHGVLVVTPIPLFEETDPNEFLGYLLRKYQLEHPRGSVIDATLPQQYVRTKDSRRLADRVIWAGLGRLPDRKKDLPTIAVEFVSAGRRNLQRDYVEKKKEYMDVGIAEYWIIDRFRRTMTVYRKEHRGARKKVIPEKQTYHTPLLPGFEVPLGRLLAVADQWAQS